MQSLGPEPVDTGSLTLEDDLQRITEVNRLIREGRAILRPLPSTRNLADFLGIETEPARHSF